MHVDKHGWIEREGRETERHVYTRSDTPVESKWRLSSPCSCDPSDSGTTKKNAVSPEARIWSTCQRFPRRTLQPKRHGLPLWGPRQLPLHSKPQGAREGLGFLGFTGYGLVEGRIGFREAAKRFFCGSSAL